MENNEQTNKKSIILIIIPIIAVVLIVVGAVLLLLPKAEPQVENEETGKETETETVKVREGHQLVGTKTLGYIEIPKEWSYNTSGMGENLHINDTVEGNFTINIESPSVDTYEEDLEDRRKTYKSTERGYTGEVEEVKTKVGKYDAVLFKAKREHWYEYEWLFLTGDEERGIMIISESKENAEKYSYIAESYRLNK